MSEDRLPFGYELALNEGGLSDEAKEAMVQFLYEEATVVLAGVEVTVIMDLLRRRAQDPWSTEEMRQDFQDLYTQVQLQAQPQFTEIEGIGQLKQEASDIRLGLTDADFAAFFDEAEGNESGDET
jgi:predicted glycosyltransferase